MKSFEVAHNSETSDKLSSEHIKRALEVYHEDVQEIEQQCVENEIGQDKRLDLLRDIIWETLVEFTGHKINEGKEAVIVEVGGTETHELLQAIEGELDPADSEALREAFVAKFHKLFKQGAAAHEIALQQRAFEIVSASPVADKIKVPQLVSVSRSHLKLRHPELFKRKIGNDQAVGDEVEFLSMEYVNGVDLATFSLRESLLAALTEQADGSENTGSVIATVLEHKIKDFSYAGYEPEVKKRIMRIMGSAVRHGGYHGTSFVTGWNMLLPEAQAFIQEHAPTMVEPELSLLQAIKNGETIDTASYLRNVKNYTLLEKLFRTQFTDRFGKTEDEREVSRIIREICADYIGYQEALGEDLYSGLQEAIRHMHAQGFYHRDLHERNLMIADDRQSMYIIDFGKSKADGTTDNNLKNYDLDPETRGVDDEGIFQQQKINEPGGLLYMLTHGEAARRP
ncbi:MAG: phosphotransferase [Candidatus Buchananbacteria bacterium]|nr:phosphotransferase [Candidatus Buchananbacteria bacterium]